VIYLAAIGIQIPFVNSSLYEGPIARSMGGADIAWIVGLAFSAVAYWLAARGNAARDRAAARQVLLQAG
jgi:nucleobase:cation symporter-1, NCS1 family